MSRVLFMENRHQTRTWETIAAGLKAAGHSVSWLVMNHGFAPKGSGVRLLPYPRKEDLAPADGRFARVVESDRGIRYYGLDAGHYRHYDLHIRRVLEEIEPEIVVGEATQFYELLTIEACRDSCIPYIVPASARYPTGRFLCYSYDTLDVVGGSAEVPAKTEIDAFVRLLSERAIVPDYMKGVASGVKSRTIWEHRRDWAYKAVQYARGERYSSPAPWKKLLLNRSIQHNLTAWNQGAHADGRTMAAEKKVRILFPLHMQPEASIDVWGRPYSDQATLIEEMAEAVGRHAILFVKPNPKPRCELSDSLLALVKRHARIVPLHSTVKMAEAFANCDLIVTVTGTIALEAIFARRPCATLIRTRNNDLDGCRYLTSPAKLGATVEEISHGHFPIHPIGDVRAFAARLFAESYPGIIQDPYSTPQSASPQNKRLLVEAFNHLIPHLLAGRQQLAPWAMA
jgi:hypothetical protein